jgi:hypothetical protein
MPRTFLPSPRRTSIGTIVLILLSHLHVARGEPGNWTQPRLIQEILVEGDAAGKAAILIQGGVPSDYIPPACNSPYNMIDLGTSKGRGQLALALSAYTSGRPIKIALQCAGDRPSITHIAF